MASKEDEMAQTEKNSETAKVEHERRIKEGRISFLSAGATRKPKEG